MRDGDGNSLRGSPRLIVARYRQDHGLASPELNVCCWRKFHPCRPVISARTPFCANMFEHADVGALPRKLQGMLLLASAAWLCCEFGIKCLPVRSSCSTKPRGEPLVEHPGSKPPSVADFGCGYLAMPCLNLQCFPVDPEKIRRLSQRQKLLKTNCGCPGRSVVDRHDSPLLSHASLQGFRIIQLVWFENLPE